MTLVQTLVGHSNYVWSASFTLENAHVVTCSSDETARVWNVRGGGQVCACIKLHTNMHNYCILISFNYAHAENQMFPRAHN